MYEVKVEYKLNVGFIVYGNTKAGKAPLMNFGIQEESALKFAQWVYDYASIEQFQEFVDNYDEGKAYLCSIEDGKPVLRRVRQYNVTFKCFRRKNNRLFAWLAYYMRDLETIYYLYPMPSLEEKINKRIVELADKYPRCGVPEVGHHAAGKKDGCYCSEDYDCPDNHLDSAQITICNRTTGEEIMGLYMTVEE